MSADLLGLTDKKVLIIGGGQGLGEASAVFLARAGADIALVDLNPEAAERVAGRVREQGRKAITIIADALDTDQVARVIAETEAGLGGLDVLVTIVGGSQLKGVLEMTLEEWDADQNRNFRYFFAYAQAAGRSMVRRDVKGCIVAIATGGALRSMPFRSGYGAAKAGLVHLVKSMAVELGDYGIRVNAVAPGATFTPNSVGYMDTPAWQAEIAKIPMGRLADPDDIARGVAFMASDMARHVTGTTLPVDGGSSHAPLYDLGSSKRKSRRNVMALLGKPA